LLTALRETEILRIRSKRCAIVYIGSAMSIVKMRPCNQQFGSTSQRRSGHPGRAAPNALAHFLSKATHENDLSFPRPSLAFIDGDVRRLYQSRQHLKKRHLLIFAEGGQGLRIETVSELNGVFGSFTP
jgi:hypothetical protein